MNEEYKVALPKLGESILNATVVQWFKQEGDMVKLDEPLLEVSTDKVNSEIPSPVAGKLIKIHAHPDQEVDVGATLATVLVSDVKEAAASAPVARQTITSEEASSDNQDFFSPVVLRLAREKGISMSQLEKIPGTGQGGRITRRDIEAYLEKPQAVQSSCAKNKTCSEFDRGENVKEIERVKMSSMRKAIADNMVKSFYEAPHATLITEVDVTKIIKVMYEQKEAFFKKYGAKLTVTSFIARALVKALQEFPLINSSLDEDTIVVKKFINLGFAVNVKDGLMVPVLKNCQQMSLPQIALGIHEISTKARSNGLTLNDIKDGSMTITNFGMTGVLTGIPIIRYPEVAILGVGAIHKKVVVVEDDLFGVRSMINISLTFDHRVLDGIYGCQFLASLKHHLESDLTIE
ncbi:MAG: 2-oxo acid dehydrogenase subunit E2 [Chlamydiae bacterium]|jgi:2-oxoglutarate dehydrogenase E2 component (dihydrolipoamide succinyltransferase)|nr:2-oxo acid dehydrogenase subunit E2 [Chlamydiota bacterium]